MRILITGGAGFIGSHLFDAFQRDGHDVIALDNFETGREENNPDAFVCDITDRTAFYNYANRSRPDLIVHCAASYKDPDKWHLDTRTNVEGGINTALAAKHHGARLFYFQTILPPVSSYAISKIASEHYQRLSGVPLTVFRMANIYGPRNISGPIPVFYKRITSGQPCLVVDTTRDMVYIDDLVRCVRRQVEEDWTGDFDVCSGVQTSIMDIYKAVAAELKHEEIPPLIPPAGDDVQGTISPSKGLPGWIPLTPLADGVAATVFSYHQDGITETHTHLRLKG